jgi:hypothetical protein
MILRSEVSEQARALPVDSIVIERDDPPFQIGLCEDADDPSPSPMPPEHIVPDHSTGLTRVRHVPKMLRQ